MIAFTCTVVLIIILLAIITTVAARKVTDKNIVKGLRVVRAVGCGVLAFALVVTLGVKSFRIVDATEVGVIKKFGELDHMITSGPNFINPLTDTVEYIDLRVHVKEVDFASYTKDAQPVTAALEYQYEPNSMRAMEIVEQFGTYEIMETKLANVVEERCKIVIARYSAMPLLENRSSLSDEVRAEVDLLEETFPVNFTSVIVRDVDFSDAFEKAVEQKMAAEQAALRAENEKKEAITRAEQEKEVAIIEAKAKIEKAKGESQAAVEKAKGEAEALNITREALANMPDAYIQQLYLEKWDGILPQFVMGEGTDVMVNPYAE